MCVYVYMCVCVSCIQKYLGRSYIYQESWLAMFYGIWTSVSYWIVNSVYFDVLCVCLKAVSSAIKIDNWILVTFLCAKKICKQMWKETIGKDMHLMSRNRTTLTFWASVNCTITICHGGSKSDFVSYVSSFFHPQQITMSLGGNSFFIFRRNKFDIFLL